MQKLHVRLALVLGFPSPVPRPQLQELPGAPGQAPNVFRNRAGNIDHVGVMDVLYERRLARL